MSHTPGGDNAFLHLDETKMTGHGTPMTRISAIIFCGLFVLNCGFAPDEMGDSTSNLDGSPSKKQEEAQPAGLPVLGSYRHTAFSIVATELALATDGLNLPRDVAFHPSRDELWVVNQADPNDNAQEGLRRGRVSVLFAPGKSDQSIQHFSSAMGGGHFFPEVSALAFSDNGNWASVHETDLPTQGASTPADFMGPTMWTSDLNYLDAGHASHLDMLHNSPSAMGVAWEVGNTFWVFDGHHSSLTRYAFNSDHGMGGHDHTDGEIQRFGEGQVLGVPGVPSHMQFDASSNMLYVADTGNNRIATMRIDDASYASALPAASNYDGVSVFEKWNATVATLVDGATTGLKQPSGLYLEGNIVFITDHETGFIWAFDRLTGETIDWLETGLAPGSLTGITGDGRGNLYIVDTLYSRVLRIAAQ